MSIEKLKPTSPSRRNFFKLNNNNLTNKNFLLKNKLKKLNKLSGKNKQGQITIYHKGGGNKNRYRILNFCRIATSTEIVLSVEYDPYRTSYISALYNEKKKIYNYIITPKNLMVGNIIKSGFNITESKLGYSLPLKNISIGTLVHNISLKTGNKSKLHRSAGSYAKLIKKNFSKALLELNSGKLKYIPLNCIATIGVVSNEYNFLKTMGKAGRSRWLNIRPTVRGVAMNPIDHPNGGGEGKKSSKKLSPWGKHK